jgi:hypothetical protein
MMKWAAIALLASSTAYAEPLVDSISRRDDVDVSHLRAKLPDDSARCALGVIYLLRDDLTRAAHYLEGCATARIAPDVAGWARLAVPRLDDRLRMSELAALEVTTTPAGLLVSIDTVPGELFATPAVIWLPAGTHAVRAGEASRSVTLGARSGAAAHLVIEGMEHSTRVDPRVAVMRENDCAIHRRRHPAKLCQLWAGHDDDDLDLRYPRRWRRLPPPRHDPLMMILQSAEEL